MFMGADLYQGSEILRSLFCGEYRYRPTIDLDVWCDTASTQTACYACCNRRCNKTRIYYCKIGKVGNKRSLNSSWI